MNGRKTAISAQPEKGSHRTNSPSPDDSGLLQQLLLHQVELEMQNDELRIANEQLELQQLKFAGIYDLAPIGYFILDQNGIINEVNNAGLTMLETAKSNIISNRLRAFVAPEYADAYYRFYRQMLHTKTRESCLLKLLSGKGHDFYVQMEGIAITPIPSLPLQCDIAVIDITERVNAEKSLSKTKERLEMALEASASGTWELELDTMKFYLDEFNYQTCAIPGGKFDGRYQTFINLIHPEDSLMVDQHFRSSLINQTEIDVVCRFVNTGGYNCFASIRGHVIREKGHPSRFIGIMMDITEKRRMEIESSQLRHDQQKKIALATLTAGENERKRISDALHDGVSQLLYGIRIRLAALETPDNQFELKNVNELLDMAIAETRNLSFELAPAMLADFGLPETLDELGRRLSTNGMTIRPRITGFSGRLNLQLEISIFRIIQELINNCMKHANASLVDLELKKNKNLIEIRVTDNGAGFQSAQPGEVPAGAGLTSIKNRVSLYNGNFSLQSEPGTGTSATVTLKVNRLERVIP